MGGTYCRRAGYCCFPPGGRSSRSLHVRETSGEGASLNSSLFLLIDVMQLCSSRLDAFPPRNISNEWKPRSRSDEARFYLASAIALPPFPTLAALFESLIRSPTLLYL